MNLNFHWQKKMGRHETGEFCKIGKWKIGGYHFARDARCGGKWRVICYLPGVRDDQGVTVTEEDARAKLEAVVTRWFQLAQEVQGD